MNPDIFNPQPKDPRIIELHDDAGNYEKGFRAYRAGDYVTAFTLLQTETRYTVVKAILGYMYFMGLGVPQDIGKAIEWFVAAAQEGHVVAQKNLGNIFVTGDGVPQDYLEAIRWYRMAADNHDAETQKRLADMYILGLGVAPDKAEALRWYHRAAENGDKVAKNYYRWFVGLSLDECQAILTGGPEPFQDAEVEGLDSE